MTGKNNLEGKTEKKEISNIWKIMKGGFSEDTREWAKYMLFASTPAVFLGVLFLIDYGLDKNFPNYLSISEKAEISQREQDYSTLRKFDPNKDCIIDLTKFFKCYEEKKQNGPMWI